MKIIFSLLAAAFLFLPTDINYACMERGATLYSLEGDTYREIAALPASYYVAVLKDLGDGYCLVSYLDVTGYIKSSELSKVDFVPKDKHSGATFTVSNDSQPANLRSRPDNIAGNVVAVMPDKASGVVIGKTQGSELVSGAGKVWYYVRFTTESGYTYGYVYSAHMKFSGFGVSSGEREQTLQSAVVSEQGRPVSEMSLPVRVVIISVLCLPVVVALFMLRPKKRGESDNVKGS